MNRLTYLDYHSTTPVDPRVADLIYRYTTEEFGNASSTGLPVLLDVTTVKGTLFNLLIKYDDLWAQTSMFAKCRQKRLFVSQVILFNQKGEIVTQKKTSKEVFDLKPDGASYRAMRLACRKSLGFVVSIEVAGLAKKL